ncbi:hypothetical protein GGS26DRAFT_475796 [Hypomontagnella submonticulosa]|nr:hypothetical protein GGS26DRAFT_475796 [Hypomontagnella submonticulosa]
MAGAESRRELVEWRNMHHRGRNKIRKANMDPLWRARLEREMLYAKTAAAFHFSEADRTSALAALPAFLFDCPAVDPGHHTGSDQSPSRCRYSFLTSFPAEVRNLIYHYAVGYPTCRTLYDSYYRQKEKAKTSTEIRTRTTNARGPRRSKIALRTPTILLLCKQITREALSLLHIQPFVIDRIPPWIMGNVGPLPLVDLISKTTLQNLRLVQVKIPLGENTDFRSGRVWLELLDDVLNAWSERNSLIRLHVMFKLSNVTRPNLWHWELQEYENIVDKLTYFAFKHGMKPGLIRWEHWVLDSSYAYKVGGLRNPLVRVHPDPYIWQGSLIEWL